MTDSVPWWVYVLTSDAGGPRTYVGSTIDPPRRLQQHNGLLRGGGGHTRAYRPWAIGRVYGPFGSRSEAQRAEAAIKRLRGAERLSWCGPAPCAVTE